MGAGLMVLAAALRSGSLAEAQEAMVKVKDTLGLLFTPDTFEYMEKNGRMARQRLLPEACCKLGRC